MPVGPTLAQEEPRVPSRDHIDLEPFIRRTAQLFRGFSLITNIHFEDASVSMTKTLSQDFRLHSSNTSVTLSLRITELVVYHDLFPRSRCCTAQAVVTTLQLSRWLWIRMNSSAYQSKQPWRDQNSYKDLQIPRF